MIISQLRTTISVGAALALLAGILTTVGARANSGSSYGSNLVVNGGAEANVGASGSSQVVKPSGWTTTGQFTVVQYGASGGFPDKTTPGPKNRGKNFFAGGNAPLSTAAQRISLVWAAPDIHAGLVRYTFAAWIGGWEGDGDYAYVTLSFHNPKGVSIGQTTLGPVTPAQRQGTTSFLERTQSGVVPKEASSAVVTIVVCDAFAPGRCVRSAPYQGPYSDGYVDDVSLILSKGS